LIEEPRAAALGAGMPIGEINGSMIVDIGGGTTEVAVFSMGELIVSRSLRVAGDELDDDILQYIRKKYNLLIGERMAEQVKIAIGSGLSASNGINPRGARTKPRHWFTGIDGNKFC